jgi:hypothetical protein
MLPIIQFSPGTESLVNVFFCENTPRRSCRMDWVILSRVGLALDMKKAALQRGGFE